jgi:hypothetical protein
MRIKILILWPLLLIAFLAINAYSINWDDPGTQTADQMISGEENEYKTGLNPQETREAQVGQKGKDILSQKIGGNLTTGSSTPQEARNLDETQNASTQSVIEDDTTSIQAEPEKVVPTISGSWSLELVDSAVRNATIILLQSTSGAVYGKGTIVEGNDTFTTTASGSISGDELNLDLVTLEKLGLYRLALTIRDDSATGDYDLFSPSSEASQSGTANAMKV